MPKVGFTSKFVSVVVLAAALCAPAGADDKARVRLPFERLVVFGTSLSDPGNFFTLTEAHSTPPDYGVDQFLIPSAPYAKGGHHFSNGPTWIEQLARAAKAKAANYAVGGARARDDGSSVHLSAQVRRFLAEPDGTAGGDTLYVIEMGANDIRDALAAGGGAAGEAILAGALESISINIMELYVRGARRFLVWNAPDLGRTPAVLALDRLSPGAAQGAGLLSQAFNANLDQLLAQLAPALPGVQLDRLDVYAKLNTVLAQPQLFGLREVESACIQPNEPPFACRHPEQYLFWDGIHPTSAAHGILAEEAARVLLDD